MSERFVRGWKVAPRKLEALVGSKRLTAREVLASKANARCKREVLMTLGDGDEKAGRRAAESALGEIFSGGLDPERDYEYARVTELLLNHVARPLAIRYATGWSEPQDQILLQLTYHVPNDSPGRWNPLLGAGKLPLLAKSWAAANVQFPWPKRRKARAPWSVWTLWEGAEFAKLTGELHGVTTERLARVPAKLLADNDADVADCRAELAAGLDRLRAWLETARAPEKKKNVT